MGWVTLFKFLIYSLYNNNNKNRFNVLDIRADITVLWIWLCSSGHSLVHSWRKISELTSSVFLVFCMKLVLKEENWRKPIFEKKSCRVRRAQKFLKRILIPERDLTKCYPFICTFFAWIFSAKWHIWEKSDM